MRGPGGILDYFTRHRTAANLLLVLVVALGIAAAPRMRTQFLPDVVFETVTVRVAWPGAGAEDVDEGIVARIEPAVLAVEGVAATESLSREGLALVSVEFEPGWDLARAEQDVKAAVDAVTGLPETAEAPEIRRRVWRDRVTDVVITGPVGLEQIGQIGDAFVSRLFEAGVTRATIRGFAAPEISVAVGTDALLAHGLDLETIARIIAAEVTPAPAGALPAAERVRSGGLGRTVHEIGDIILRVAGDGAPLRLRDVATITEEGPDRQVAYFVGDNPAISIRIDRPATGDAVATQRTVERVAAALRPELPAGVRIDLVRTRAEAISGRLSILFDNGLIGLGLVLVVLFLFLNARTAFWVAAGIPVAMCATVALMYAAGLTLNVISLFALIMTLGMVVDDAIVVGEHADFRARRLGERPLDAAANAARRMAAPVVAATVTTVIAFLGLVVIGGRFGDLIADIPFTVAAVLSASLLECFLILPNHMAHALKATPRRRWYDAPSRLMNRVLDWFRRRLFVPFVAGAIRLRYPALAAAVLLLSLQAAAVLRGDIPWRFFNAPERASITGNFAMAPSATRADSERFLRALQTTVDEVGAEFARRHGENPVEFVLGQIGGTAGRGLSGEEAKDPDLLGAISIELIDPERRPYSSFDFLAELQRRAPRDPMLETLSFRGWRSGPGGDAISVDIFGADAKTLKAAAEALKAALAAFPETSALEDNLAYDRDELIIQMTPQGLALGFTPETVAAALRQRLEGIEAASFPVGPRSAVVRVELARDELKADFIDRLVLPTPAGGLARLSEIAEISRQGGFSTVRRSNGLRVVTVSGDIAEDDPERAAAVMRALTEEILPAIERDFSVGTRVGGLAEQERAFLSDAMLGLVLCLVGIYLVLAWIFSSWRRPLVVMAVIPFGAIGAIWGHHEWGVPLSMFSVIGLIGMTGIIINDAIVLVSTVDEYARRRALRPALLAAVGDRLRPVFLTTATTVLGLAPLLFERSQQAQFLKPTVITLVYGLGFGMVLVLLVVPAVLGIGEDLARIRRSTRRLFGLAARRGGWRLWLPLALTIAGLLGAMAATIGRHAMVGEAWAPLAGVVPPGLGGAVAAQIAGSVLVVAAGAFLAFVLMPGAALRRSAAGRAAQKLDDVVAEEGQPHH